jgi:hypothetical protein
MSPGVFMSSAALSGMETSMATSPSPYLDLDENDICGKVSDSPLFRLAPPRRTAARQPARKRACPPAAAGAALGDDGHPLSQSFSLGDPSNVMCDGFATECKSCVTKAAFETL